MADSITIKLQGQLQLQWHAARSPTSDRWVGVCDAMNLSMEADSLDELHGLINETLQLLLTDLLLDNELDQFLRERGWQAGDVPQGPDVGEPTFDVPWELIAEGQRDPERRPH